MNLQWLFIGLLAFIAVISCSNPEVTVPDNGLAKYQTGTISITIARPIQGKDLTNSIASKYADTYEVFAYSPTGTISYNVGITPGETSSLVVPTGTYDVIALAGEHSDSSTNIALVGTAEADNVSISPGIMTPVSLTLRVIGMALALPQFVDSDTAYSAVLTLDLKLPKASLSVYPTASIRACPSSCTAKSESHTATMTSIGSVMTLTYANLIAPVYNADLTADLDDSSVPIISIKDGSFRTNLVKAYPNNFAYDWTIPGIENCSPIIGYIAESNTCNVVQKEGLDISIGWDSDN